MVSNDGLVIHFYSRNQRRARFESRIHDPVVIRWGKTLLRHVIVEWPCTRRNLLCMLLNRICRRCSFKRSLQYCAYIELQLSSCRVYFLSTMHFEECLSEEKLSRKMSGALRTTRWSQRDIGIPSWNFVGDSSEASKVLSIPLTFATHISI